MPELYDTERKPHRWIVTGLPASGKSTWIQERRTQGAFVWDTDEVAATVFNLPTYPRPDVVMRALNAMRDAAIRTLAQWPVDMYVISTDAAQAHTLAAAIGGQVMRCERDEETRQQRLEQRAKHPPMRVTMHYSPAMEYIDGM